MKYFFLCFLLLFLTFSQNNGTQENKYINVIKVYKKVQGELFDQKKWEKIKAVDKSTDKEKRLTEFEPLQQHVLIYSFAQQLSADGEKYQKAWQKEIDNFVDSNKNTIKLEDIENYADELKLERRKFAIQFESFVSKMFKDFEKDLTENEIKALSVKIKKNHENMGLIQRNR